MSKPQSWQSAFSPVHATFPQLSVNNITTYRWSLDQEIIAYQKLGIDGIGLWRRKLELMGEPQSVELLLESELNVTSLSWIGGFTGSLGWSFDEAIDDGLHAIGLASRLNANSILLATGGRAVHIQSHARRIVLEGIRRLADAAGEHGVLLALHPMSNDEGLDWSLFSNIDETLGVIDECDHPNLRMAFNTYYLWKEENLLDRIPSIAGFVSTVLLNDWRPPRQKYDRCQLGDGQIPLADIVGAFLQSDFHGDFEVDIWSSQLWKTNYHLLLRNAVRRFESLCETARVPLT